MSCLVEEERRKDYFGGFQQWAHHDPSIAVNERSSCLTNGLATGSVEDDRGRVRAGDWVAVSGDDPGEWSEE